jgi:hypothetical protein
LQRIVLLLPMVLLLSVSVLTNASFFPVSVFFNGVDQLLQLLLRIHR